MYGYTEGENDTPREDSPVIFVITEKLKKVHPLPHHRLQPDWVSSNKGDQWNIFLINFEILSSGSVGGGGEQRAEWQDIVVKRSDEVDLKHRPQHQSAPHNSLLYKIWRFILVCIELLELIKYWFTRLRTCSMEFSCWWQCWLDQDSSCWCSRIVTIQMMWRYHKLCITSFPS